MYPYLCLAICFRCLALPQEKLGTQREQCQTVADGSEGTRARGSLERSGKVYTWQESAEWHLEQPSSHYNFTHIPRSFLFPLVVVFSFSVSVLRIQCEE